MRNYHPPFRTEVLLTVLILTGLFACKSDKEEPIPNEVQGDWQLTAVKSDPAYTTRGIALTDLLAGFSLVGDTCPSQLTFTFRESGTVQVSGPDECKSTSEQILGLLEIDNTTTWKRQGDQLVLTTGANELSADLQVSETTMTLTSNRLLDDGITHDISVIFQRL